METLILIKQNINALLKISPRCFIQAFLDFIGHSAGFFTKNSRFINRARWSFMLSVLGIYAPCGGARWARRVYPDYPKISAKTALKPWSIISYSIFRCFNKFGQNFLWFLRQKNNDRNFVVNWRLENRGHSKKAYIWIAARSVNLRWDRFKDYTKLIIWLNYFILIVSLLKIFLFKIISSASRQILS